MGLPIHRMTVCTLEYPHSKGAPREASHQDDLTDKKHPSLGVPIHSEYEQAQSIPHQKERRKEEKKDGKHEKNVRGGVRYDEPATPEFPPGKGVYAAGDLTKSRGRFSKEFKEGL